MNLIQILIFTVGLLIVGVICWQTGAVFGFAGVPILFLIGAGGGIIIGTLMVHFEDV